MRKRKYSKQFAKAISKLKGKELENVLKKRDAILSSISLTQYKNLKHSLKKYKRVHVNDSYIILFFGDDQCVYFVDYAHHDIVYKKKYEYNRFS